MSVPQRLTRRLQQTLGAEAAEDLVNLLNGVELQRSELRAFREGMRSEFAEFRVDMVKQTAATQQQMGELSAATQKQISDLSAAVSTGLERVKADLLKWSFVFWVGAVGAIAGLAGVLR
jgi:hypothetical protein